MKIELKKVKHFPELSEETSCFTAEIFVNGKKAGYAKNRGHGGETEVYAEGSAKKLFQTAEAFCKLLPPFTAPDLANPIPMDLAVYVDDLIDKYLTELEREMTIKELNKLVKNCIVIVLKKELDEFQRGTGTLPSTRMLRYKVNLFACQAASIKREIERVRKDVLKPGEVIYNDFSYLDMVYSPAFDTKKVGGDWKQLRENLKKNFEVLKGIDKKSKDLGQILYRYFEVPVADGKAFYQIVSVSRSSAKIRICNGICPDEYTDRQLGEESIIKLSMATDFVKRRDALEGLFKKE